MTTNAIKTVHPDMFNFKIHRLTGIVVDKWLDIVEKRIRDYILLTYPLVTQAMITKWRAKFRFMVLEPFNWVDWPNYYKLMRYHAGHSLENCIDEIYRGDFGSWLHQAA